MSAARSSNIECGAACARCHASRRETKIIQPNQFFRCLIKISCRSPPLNSVCRPEFFHGSTNDPLPVSRVQNLPLTANDFRVESPSTVEIPISVPPPHYPNTLIYGCSIIRMFSYPHKRFVAYIYVQYIWIIT